VILEQASSLGPFPGEFIPFAEVASRASQYQVVNTVSRNIAASNSAEWKGVFDVVDILAPSLLEFSMSTSSIIASAFLPLQLLLDLSTGMFAFDALFSCSVGMAYCLIHYLVLLVMSLMAILSVFFVCLIVSFASFRNVVFVNLIVLLTVLFVLFFMCIVPDFLTCKALASDCGSHAILFASFALASLALIVKPYFLRCTTMKKLFSQWVDALACRTSPVPFRDICGFRRSGKALLAIRVQSVTPPFGSREEIYSSRLDFFTFAASLMTFWYSNVGLFLIFFVGYHYTAFALSIEPIFLAFMGEKMFFGSRKELVTFPALLEGNIDVLGYNITHGKANSFSSRLQMLTASWGQKHVQFMRLLYHKLAWRASL